MVEWSRFGTSSESGHFRGEGSATGGGSVHLANGGYVDGAPHGEGGETLRQHLDDLVTYLSSIEDPRARALVYFAAVTRRQFYFDGNKRTARLMMAGELMANGHDVVSVPYSRRLEFNVAPGRLVAGGSGVRVDQILRCQVDDAVDSAA